MTYIEYLVGVCESTGDDEANYDRILSRYETLEAANVDLERRQQDLKQSSDDSHRALARVIKNTQVESLVRTRDIAGHAHRTEGLSNVEPSVHSHPVAAGSSKTSTRCASSRRSSSTSCSRRRR